MSVVRLMVLLALDHTHYLGLAFNQGALTLADKE